MLNQKYEQLTGIELPVKKPTAKRIYKVKTFACMCNVLKNTIFDGYSWGKAINNACELRKLKNNIESVEIEAYYIFGNLTTLFIIY